MKSKNLLFVLCLFSTTISFHLSHAQQYYWSSNKKYPLAPDSTIVVIKIDDVEASQLSTQGLENRIEFRDEYAVYRNVKKTNRDDLKRRKIVYSVGYRTNEEPVIITNVISLLPKGQNAELERSFPQIRFRDKTPSGVYHYTLKNFRETLNVANAIAESGLVEWKYLLILYTDLDYNKLV